MHVCGTLASSTHSQPLTALVSPRKPCRSQNAQTSRSHVGRVVYPMLGWILLPSARRFQPLDMYRMSFKSLAAQHGGEVVVGMYPLRQ